ncbi:hypothetical protein DRO54_10000 [Candidatus Bathyarchaeota archaeon]|nr:MAG: hypothetical protein DRO54_10000 [Candidatus Bathyarchaeota archaeon]
MEEIVCVVEDVRAAGVYTRSDTWAFNEYDVFFTNRRVIFAVVRCPADSSEAQAFPKRSEVLDKLAKVDARVEQLNKMYGSVKRWMEIKEERRKQFKGKTPEEILHLHPESFDIPYENIKSVKLRKWSIFGTTLEIKALLKGEEKKFKLAIPKQHFKDVQKNVVNKYLPGK